MREHIKSIGKEHVKECLYAVLLLSCSFALSFKKMNVAYTQAHRASKNHAPGLRIVVYWVAVHDKTRNMGNVVAI